MREKIIKKRSIADKRENFLKPSCPAGNSSKEINTWAVSLLRCSGQFLNDGRTLTK